MGKKKFIFHHWEIDKIKCGNSIYESSGSGSVRFSEAICFALSLSRQRLFSVLSLCVICDGFPMIGCAKSCSHTMYKWACLANVTDELQIYLPFTHLPLQSVSNQKKNCSVYLLAMLWQYLAWIHFL